jgi:hypothetical protein
MENIVEKIRAANIAGNDLCKYHTKFLTEVLRLRNDKIGPLRARMYELLEGDDSYPQWVLDATK